MASIITLEAVNKYYGQGANRIHVLKDISFAVEDGDFVAIIGQSGSGKSTLMNIIGCLDTPIPIILNSNPADFINTRAEIVPQATLQKAVSRKLNSLTKGIWLNIRPLE